MKRCMIVQAALAVSLALFSCSRTESRNVDGSPSVNPLRVALPGSIATLDLGQEGGILNYYVTAITQESLVAISNEGKIIPALAESWEDENAMVWRFFLRSDAKFQDGSPVTPEDIIYSFNRARDPLLSPSTSFYFPEESIESIEKTGERLITITLTEPRAGFLWALAGGLFVTSRQFIESAEVPGSPGDLVLGSGPYKAVEFVPGSHALFERVDTWWGPLPEIEAVRFDFIEDDQTRFLAFQQGAVDLALNVPVDQAARWEQVNGAELEFILDRSYQGLTFDPNVEPFDDPHVRKAFASAIDKDRIVAGIFKGHAQTATAIPSPQQFTTVMDEAAAQDMLAGVFHYEYSIEKAKAELAQSKVPDGFTTTISYPSAYQNLGRASLAIAENLKAIGVTVEAREIPLELWVNEVGNGAQGVAWMIYVPTTGEPGEITHWLLDARGSGFNPANWFHPETARLTAEARSAETLEAQADLVVRANNIAQEEAVYVPIYWGETAVAFSKGLRLKEGAYTSFTLLSVWPLLFEW
ncbi:MAG: ABC transporter substrate-binding protein [Treponema sp.]|jgi:peptide/nickel transport system substrate-binding protein|nr:ABC transporter substrate-binding protein [Treponema sp.]